MQALTREEVVQRRKYFLTRAQKTTVVSKGAKRTGGTRICAICQTPLSRVILTTGGTQSIREHYHCKMSDMLTVNICKDSKICQKVHELRRREEEHNASQQPER